MLRKLSIAAAIAAVLLIPAAASAASNQKGAHSNRSAPASRSVHVNRNAGAKRNVHVNRNVRVNRAHRNVHVKKTVRVRAPRIGHRYHGGIWYGHRRHYWRGRWYAYGVGSCWLRTPIGFVWVCF